MRRLKVSIVTAVYNGESSIVATLKSVASQDYPNIEHIVVDGDSNDMTPALVQANSDRISEFISERDTGVYDAFNKGLRRATGDVVAYLNCGDTYVFPDVVSRIIGALSREGVQAAFADVLIVDSKDWNCVIRRYSSRKFAPKFMAFGLMPAHPTLFLHRKIYERVGGYNTDFRIAGDFELCIRVFLKAATRYYYLNYPVVRMPTGGLSNRGWRSKFAITNEMLEACKINDVQSSYAKLCLRFPLKFLEMI